MPVADFHLDVSRDEMLAYYSGHGSRVVVQSDTGLWIQFPASRLRAFVNHDGVHGRFRLYYDELGHIERLEKLQGQE